jgi:hypothetical protein
VRHIVSDWVLLISCGWLKITNLHRCIPRIRRVLLTKTVSTAGTGTIVKNPIVLRKPQVHRRTSFFTMVECVGCRQTLKNGKAYSNHQRACKEYKAAGALRLRQMQLNKAKKVERALQLHMNTNEESNGLLIHEEYIQDLNHEVVPVSNFSNYFSRLTLEYIGRNCPCIEAVRTSQATCSTACTFQRWCFTSKAAASTSNISRRSPCGTPTPHFSISERVHI